VEWKITSELLFGMLIPAAARSKAYVCSNLITRFVSWNPSEGTDVSSFVLVVCYVGSGLCEELITRSEESYRFFFLPSNLEHEAV
jgi:hypothetical protein